MRSSWNSFLAIILLLPFRMIWDTYRIYNHFGSSDYIASRQVLEYCDSKNYIHFQGVKWHAIWPIRYFIAYPNSLKEARRMNAF
jgi:hypothetical protein